MMEILYQLCVLANNLVIIGTVTGNLYKLDNLGSTSQLPTKHSSKITSILIESNTVISSCQRGNIFIQDLNNEFDEVLVSLGGSVPVNCMRVKDQFDLNNIQLLIGTNTGNVIFYSKGWLSENIVDVHKDKTNEPITSLSYCNGVLVWANKNDIKIRDIQCNKKLGLIAAPEMDEEVVNKDVKERAAPCVIMKRKSENKCILAYSWIYVVRVYLCTRETPETPARIQKFHEFSLNPLQTYLCGFTFIDENFLFIEFPEEESYKPYYIVYSENNDCLFKESIKQAENYPQYLGIHYTSCTMKSHSSDGQCILYNPESVFQIQPITLKERVLFLLSKKRLEECIFLVKENLHSLPQDIIIKVRNTHLDQLLKEKNFYTAASLVSEYCGENIEQWRHWVMIFRNKKSLGFISELVPVGFPIKLPTDLYELMFEVFIKENDFGNLLVLTERVKPHLMDYTGISRRLNETYDLNNDLLKNSLFFKTLLLVTEYVNNKLGLFLLFLKSKSEHVFDLLSDGSQVGINQFEIEIDVTEEEEKNYIIELMRISPIRTVCYFLEKDKIDEGVIERVVNYLKITEEKELFYFLDALHKEDGIMSVPYNHLQPRLYIEYDKQGLLEFLKSTSEYSIDEVLKMCSDHHLLEETVFLLEKKGSNSDRILEILIDELGDFKQAIEYVFTRQIGNKDLWDSLFIESKKKPEYLGMLLRYAEYYSKPEMLIETLPNGVILKDVRESLMEAFQQIKLQLGILDNFKLLTKNELLLAMDCEINHAFSGEVITEGECRYCHEPLIDYEVLEEIKSSQPIRVTSKRRQELRNLTKEMNKLSIITFPNCGHTMHLKCLPSHRNCIYAEKVE